MKNATRRILREVVSQMYQAGHMLERSHSRRNEKQWADELTHPSPLGCCPSVKVEMMPLFSRLVLIPTLLGSRDSRSWFDTDTDP